MIDEKKLVEKLNKITFEAEVHNSGYKGARTEKMLRYEDVMSIINKQPKVGEWIPVSERLPNEEEFKKDDGRFMLDDGNRRYQGFFDIRDGCFKFLANISGLFPELVEDKDVIAWQPLPERYQNDEQEE